MDKVFEDCPVDRMKRRYATLRCTASLAISSYCARPATHVSELSGPAGVMLAFLCEKCALAFQRRCPAVHIQTLQSADVAYRCDREKPKRLVCERDLSS